jgi:hypothetical protein
MASAGELRMCSKCLALCDEIISEELDEPAQIDHGSRRPTPKFDTSEPGFCWTSWY